MRALALLATLMATLPLGFVAPFIGTLIWCWLSFMNPQLIIFIPGLPVVYTAAVITAIGLVISREPKRLPRNAGPWVLLAFALWTTVTSIFALDPTVSWDEWTRDIKGFVLAFTVMIVMNNRIRIHALVWVYVLSVAFFSLKGGVFTLATGGNSHVFGIIGSVTGDNNNLGLIMVMSWPLLFYLRLHTANRYIRIALIVIMGLTVTAVLGTYSRGAFLALAAVAGYFWWKAKQKFAFGIFGLIVIVPAILFMPQQWVDRIHTIDTYEADGSAMGRLNQWGFAMRIAADHPLVGSGYNAAESLYAVSKYYPDEHTLAYHSIWFQALGDHGIVGLALFIAVGLVGWRNADVVRRASLSRPDLAWARDLATMCQVSLTGYFLAGTFLSLAYYDGYYTLFAMLAALRELATNPAALAAEVRQRSSVMMPLALGARTAAESQSPTPSA
jgi:probable O-glycosylation ligase (exosortase A-associated)